MIEEDNNEPGIEIKHLQIEPLNGDAREVEACPELYPQYRVVGADEGHDPAWIGILIEEDDMVFLGDLPAEGTRFYGELAEPYHELHLLKFEIEEGLKRQSMLLACIAELEDADPLPENTLAFSLPGVYDSSIEGRFEADCPNYIDWHKNEVLRGYRAGISAAYGELTEAVEEYLALGTGKNDLRSLRSFLLWHLGEQ